MCENDKKMLLKFLRELVSEHIAKKTNTIHQLTTTLFTSKNVLLVFPGHKTPPTTSAYDLAQQRWLAGGYDLEIGQF